MHILNILIPTRNRVDCVNTIVQDLVNSKGYCSNIIGITVLDNASDSGDYRLPHDVKLIKRSQSVCAIENIMSACQLSQGMYTWILGDDDTFRSDVLVVLLELIQEMKPGVVRLTHKYIETDAILRSYATIDDSQGLQGNRLFEWNNYSVKSLVNFEDKAGFISSNIFDRAILRRSLEISRNLVSASIYSDNVYLTKLYAYIAVNLAGGYWQSNEILVWQRIPTKNRNFVDNAVVEFSNFVEAPAEIYGSLASFNKSLSTLLLRVHYNKNIDLKKFLKGNVDPLRIIYYYLTSCNVMPYKFILKRLKAVVLLTIKLQASYLIRKLG